MSQTLRLGDQIFQAFNSACDQRRLDVAELLLAALELAQEAAPEAGARGLGETEAAQEQLRVLRLRVGAMH